MDIQTQGLDPETLEQNWSVVHSLINEEWSEIDQEALTATEGNADQLVDLISGSLDCTKLRVRRQLGELVVLATSDPATQEQTSKVVDRKVSAIVERWEDKLQPFLNDGSEKIQKAKAAVGSAIDGAQTRANDIKDKVGKHIETTLPEAEEMIKRNLWSSLLITLGIGMIFGLLWGTRGR
jgi:ElaB/YqjD/DUF883 family membrane-anchored ribosome-binding protein